ncbi:LysR substrate-binding domain-containing protein, partial [Myxococcus sp. AB036A]|uniref:LysR substrate-binding domain-containing protein n=1 Tax=Myxococcus sp. AB036A TaxID=2562793 RepID=UPI0021030013
FRARHPRVEVDVIVEQRLVDIVAEGYDAGVRLSETIERDMVQVRLTDAFRFVVVGAPAYLEKHGHPERPEDLRRHECIVLRSQTTGTPYAWELERGNKTWRVPVQGSVATNDELTSAALAAEGLGLAYALEPAIQAQLDSGRLVRVLEDYAPTVPGFFLYYPSRAQRSKPLRLFVEAARELATRAG